MTTRIPTRNTNYSPGQSRCHIESVRQVDLAEQYIALGNTLSRSIPLGSRSNQVLLKDNGRLFQVCSSLREKVSQLEEALRLSGHVEEYDELTGLHTRRVFAERFKQASALEKRRKRKIALLFLDLDNFKQVNDTLGHAAGDLLLQQFAARLSAGIRESDTACRYGGDEFLALLTEVDDDDDVLTAKSKIVAHLAAPYSVNETSCHMTASIGVAIYPDDGMELTDLVQQADRSMYRNKRLLTTASGH